MTHDWKTKISTPFLTAGVLILAALLALSLASQPLERAKAADVSSLSVTDRYTSEMENLLDQVVFGEAAVKKHYRISDTAQAAPEPDPDCYGEAESPAELQWLLDQAAELLDGQELYFSTETELFPGSTVHYYLDETILAITWKEVIDKVVYTFSEVKLADASQFRRYLSGGEFGSGTLALTSEMSQSVNAVVACNGDFYAYRRKGITVTNGVVQKFVDGVKDNCFIDRNGDLILERDLAFSSTEEVQAYVDEHDINFSLSFGPILIQEGELVCPQSYSLGEVRKGFPRSAICQMDTLHYLFAATNMELHYYTNLTMMQFAESLMGTGCLRAYALDGGQTATVVMNDTLINNVNYGSERLISDIIYFATAKQAGG